MQALRRSCCSPQLKRHWQLELGSEAWLVVVLCKS
jgi:hypothetical protein